MNERIKQLEAALKTALECLDEAPVDFLGTGSDGAWADKCEQEWLDGWLPLCELIDYKPDNWSTSLKAYNKALLKNKDASS